MRKDAHEITVVSVLVTSLRNRIWRSLSRIWPRRRNISICSVRPFTPLTFGFTDFNRAVTNAGISGPKAPPESSSADELHDTIWHGESVEDWYGVMKTNVTAVYFSTLAFLPLLQASIGKFAPRSPSVIVISSMSGIMRQSQGHFAYNTAKGATVHLSKLMSSEFEKAEVRVNSIAPGYFPSEMTMKESDDSNKTHMPAEKVQEKGLVPADRPGSVEEMAQAVIFLCKNMYVNGEVLAVDGGVLNQVPGR